MQGSWRGSEALWIVMEYCGGGSVADLMHASDAPLDQDMIAYICAETLAGLTYLHSIGKVCCPRPPHSALLILHAQHVDRCQNHNYGFCSLLSVIAHQRRHANVTCGCMVLDMARAFKHTIAGAQGVRYVCVTCPMCNLV